MSEQARSAENQDLLTHVRATVVAGSTVCAYVPTRTEPGSTDLLDAIADVADRVLVPITGPPGPLSWADYTGVENLRTASYGLREPDGAVLAPATIAQAECVLVPALSVDRAGNRLGRGAGFYDRSLTLASANARLIAIVRDCELVDHLPADPHDVALGWALTPTAGSIRLHRDFPLE